MAKKVDKEILKQKKQVREQKREDILNMLKLYRRRCEYVIVVTFLFILLGHTVKAVQLKSLVDFELCFKTLETTFFSINERIFPITIIFIVAVIGVFFVLYPKKMKVAGVTTLFLAITLVFFIPKTVSSKIFLTINDFLLLLMDYLSRYLSVVIAFLSIFLLLILFNRRTRKLLFKMIKYGSELFMLSSLFYFSGLHRQFDFLDFVSDYWNFFKKGIEYLKEFTDVSMMVYLIIVFFLIYSSTIRGTKFHIKELKNLKEQLRIKTEITVTNEEIRTIYSDKDWPKIGICVPAYNEELTISKTLNSILECDYPHDKLQILVVCDGSTDNTLEVLKKQYKMEKLPESALKPVYEVISHKQAQEVYRSTIYSNVGAIYKKNGGKFDALNTGLQYFTEDVEYAGVIDADTTLDVNSFRILATEIIKSPEVVALAGTILPRDEFKWYQPKKVLLTVWQFFDYLCSFHLSRASMSLMNSMMIVSGAYGFFNRKVLLSIGGYKESLGEDMILTLELQQYKKHIIKYVPEAVAYTQVPTTFKMIRKQRMRWFKGLTESLNAFRKIGKVNPRMQLSYLEFRIVEWITPLLAPFGLFLLLAKPEMLNSNIFQVAIGLAIITPMIQGIISLFIESMYRPVKWWKLLFIPIQVFLSPLTILWRNDALLDFSSKAWGRMSRS